MFEQIRIDMAYLHVFSITVYEIYTAAEKHLLHVFLITVYEIHTAPEKYLEPVQTYLLELFSGNSLRLQKKVPS